MGAGGRGAQPHPDAEREGALRLLIDRHPHPEEAAKPPKLTTPANDPKRTFCCTFESVCGLYQVQRLELESVLEWETLEYSCQSTGSTQ